LSASNHRLTGAFYHSPFRVNAAQLQMIIIMAGGAPNSSTWSSRNILLAKAFLSFCAVSNQNSHDRSHNNPVYADPNGGVFRSQIRRGAEHRMPEDKATEELASGLRKSIHSRHSVERLESSSVSVESPLRNA